MKDLRIWAEEYVLAVASSEDDRLELKGRKKLGLTICGVDENVVRRELSVALSALANSGGGAVVYGVTAPKGAGVSTMAVCALT